MTSLTRRVLAGISLFALASCSTAQQAQVIAFEAKAAPVIAQACATLHSVEANPLLQGSINIGLAAASGATGGAAGAAIGVVKGMGDAYCLNGPPLNDTTTPAQQAAWLLNQIIPPLTAAIAPPAK
jgi:membrane protease subunit (stomatin/prohibitin family)